MYFYSEEGERISVEETRVEQRPIQRRILGETVEIEANVRVHISTGEALADETLDVQAQQLAFSAYRERHNIPTAEEIVRLREQYGLSQRSLSALLGFGPITVHRYEGGDLPDAAHAQALRRLRNPADVSCLLAERGASLSPSVRRKVESRLRTLLLAGRSQEYLKLARLTALHEGPDIHTGYRRFQSDVFSEMVVYFATIPGGVSKTKLNKLLWYADFLHFQRYSVGLSGAVYLRLPYGPVPDQAALLFGALEEEGDIEIREEFFASGSGELFLALRASDPALLGEEGIETLNAVITHFASVSSEEIFHLSHQEKAWQDTPEGKVISYRFASDLRVRFPERLLATAE